MNIETPFRFTFFLPNARLLRENEIANLPEEKIRSAASTGSDGIWLEIACPDPSCLDAEGRITLPTGEPEGKGFFLNLFCPEGSCEIAQATDLP
jgi:hypothetical protein